MSKNSATLIKCIVLLNLCRTGISDADPKFGDLYLKMCSVLRIPRFCLSYMMASNPYPFYTLPLGGPVPLPIAPFPLIVNPTPSIGSFTIPTVYTTTRPGGAPNMGSPGPSGPSSAQPPAQPPQQQQPPPGLQCPPSPPICPPAALSMPIIDPRQGNIQWLSNIFVTLIYFSILKFYYWIKT